VSVLVLDSPNDNVDIVVAEVALVVDMVAVKVVVVEDTVVEVAGGGYGSGRG
jgi:hypothetical protein